MTNLKTIESGMIEFEDRPDFKHDVINQDMFKNKSVKKMNKQVFLDIELTTVPNDINDQPQDYWIEHFNGTNRGFASAADYYHAAKQIMDEPYIKRNRLLHKSLCSEVLLQEQRMTSTNISFLKYNLDELIHHHGSDIILPEKKLVRIPVLYDVAIDDILKTNEGFAFLQALFNTNDDATDIKKGLQLFTNTPTDKILVRTTTTTPNSMQPYGEVRFMNTGNTFYILAQNTINMLGRARGVRYG